LIYGELPSKEQYLNFSHEVMHHTFVHFNVAELMRNFNYDAHPMGLFISGIAAMSTFHSDANPALAVRFNLSSYHHYYFNYVSTINMSVVFFSN